MARLFFLLILVVCGVVQPCLAQLNDDFSDGDFSSNPTWSGNTGSWQVNTLQQLQLNAPAAGTAYLSSTAPNPSGMEWRGWIKLGFSPSSSNYARYYLAADQNDLSSPTLNGYFLQFGEAGSTDAVELFRQNGGTLTSIARGTDGQIAAAFTLRFKVTCDNSGNWNLYADLTGGNAFQLLDSGVDVPGTSYGLGGPFTNFTISNITNFWFDDLYAGPPIIDTTPPLLLSATALNQSNADVLFNEGVDTNTANNILNYQITGGIQVSQAARDALNPELVHLSFQNPLSTNVNYTLTVSGINDLSGNTIGPGASTVFGYFLPATAGWNDVIINEIMADPNPVIAMPNTEFVELFNRSNQSFNLTGWTISDGASTATLPSITLLPGDFLLLCPSSSASLFTGPVAGLSNFPSINNTSESLFLRNDQGQAIDSITFDLSWYNDAIKQDGGWTLEKINPALDNICSGSSNWAASINPNGGTPGVTNSIYNSTPDINAPQITGISFPSTNQLSVCFSEALDPSTIQTAANYSVGAIGNANSAILQTGNTCLLLDFSNPFLPGTNYLLSLPLPSDCSGNSAGNSSYAFTYYEPQQYDVVINEIFADPSPQNGLPNFEFLELHNTTPFNIDLSGWHIEIGSSNLPLQSITLPADSFMILTSSAALSDYSSYGIVNVLSGMSSTALTNAGNTLTLTNSSGSMMHQVVYSDSWYHDSQKQDGGWSLEMIDPNNPCNGIENWSASIFADGGTPGRTNSIRGSNPDLQAPAIAGVRVSGNNQLEVYLSEPIVNSSQLMAVQFSVDQGIGVATQLQLSGNPVQSLLLTFAGNFQINQIYLLSIGASLSDCAGNNSTTGQTASFARYQANPYDVVIHEIMCDPEPASGLPPVEYLELFNRTSFPINLLGWQLSINGNTEVLSGIQLPANGYAILASTSSASQLPGASGVVGLSSTALTNAGGEVVLRDSSGLLVHAVAYSDAWYADEGKSAGGWSLEMIDPENPCGEFSNWKASINPSGGTPGIINSITANQPDQTAPYLLYACPVSGNILEAYFSEPMDSVSISQLQNWMVSPVSMMPTQAQAIGPFFTSVKLVFTGIFAANTEYTLSFSGVGKDCVGNNLNTAQTGFYIGAVDPYEVQINEIMFDPDPPVALDNLEYIELYNRSGHPVSLKDWSLSISGAETSLPCITIPQNGFQLIVPEGSAPQNTAFKNAIKLPGFSSLSNTGSTISLKDQFGKIISSISYTSSWYDNASKTDGGWSIEQIDVANPCGGAENWKASEDNRGGTPGETNSVIASRPDTLLPSVWRIGVIDANHIRVHFTEPLQLLSMLNTQRYQISESIGNPISLIPLEPDFRSIELTLPTALLKGVTYTLSVLRDVRDCAGNEIGVRSSARFGLPDSLIAGDILINEVLFNPREDGFDYVEIYNQSTKIIELKGLRFSNINPTDGSVENPEEACENSYLILPGEYYFASEHPDAVLKQYYSKNPLNYVESSDLPSMNTTEGSIALVTRSGEILDQLQYTDDMHFALISDPKGVALERIQPDIPSAEIENWTSASQQSGFGTPGYQNSQYTEQGSGAGQFVLSSEIFSPDNDGYQDNLLVTYTFSDPGVMLSVTVFDADGRPRKNLLNNHLAGSQGSFIWDGIDDNGNKAGVGIYVLLMEYFTPGGKTGRSKKTVVMAEKL